MPQYLSSAVPVNNGYYYQVKRNPDGSVGVDYFNNAGQPIPNNVFGQATGVNPSTIEDNAANGFEGANTQYAQQAAADGTPRYDAGGHPITAAGAAAFPTQPAGVVSANTFGSIPDAAGSGALGGALGGIPATPAPATPAPDIKIFNNKGYDFNNSADRLNYFNDRLSGAQTLADQGLNSTKSKITSALGTAANQFATGNNDLNNAQNTYDQTYGQNVGNINENYNVGSVNRSAFYGGVSPNAYQSSQGTSELYAHDKFLQGLGALATGKTQADNSYGDQRTSLANSYNQYVKDQQQALTDAGNQATNYVAGQKDSVAQSLVPFDPTSGVGDFTSRYNLGAPAAQPNVDISQYTPYTNYNSLIGNNPFAASTKAFVPPQKTTDPLSQYLGYSPNQTDTNYLRKYLAQGYA